jgi:hypothetical protein
MKKLVFKPQKNQHFIFRRKEPLEVQNFTQRNKAAKFLIFYLTFWFLLLT